MKKIVQSTPIKVGALLLSFIMALIFLFSGFMTLLMVNYQFYFSDEKTVKTEILSTMALKEARYISIRLKNDQNLSNYYKDKNVYYIVDSADGELLDQNYRGQEYIATAEYEHTVWKDRFSGYDQNGNQTYYSYQEHTADIKVLIAADMKHNDIFSLASKLVAIGFKLQYFMIVLCAISCICTIILFVYLFCAAGHTQEGIKLNYIDKLPVDIYLCIVALVALGNAVIVGAIPYNLLSSVAVIIALFCVDYFILLSFLLSCATRIKTGTFFKNSIIYRVLLGLKNTFKAPAKYLKFTFTNLSVIWKTIVIICIIAFFEFFFIIYSYNLIIGQLWEGVIIPIVILSILAFLVILYFAAVLAKIKKGGEEIAKGNVDYKINTEYMLGDFKQFSNDFNNLNQTLQNAVNERMKSERFKVELITNVSHDIKTPLTSIINYVDLIKKEKIDNEKVNEYIEVLDRQSGRLKKLVEDLVEASKASSGNISVDLAPCNIMVLLNQALGEFSEKLANAKLTPILRADDDGIAVLADGRHLWRVFDNLLSNACKYALSGTRLYIDVKPVRDGVEIIFRNISKYELDPTAEDLSERFVRGDKSRHTEGHGLGLAISKSLLELQGGSLNVAIDGDLFKATVKVQNP